MAGANSINVATTVKLIFVAILVYGILLYWAEFMRTFVFEQLGWEENAKGRFKFAVLMTVLVLLVLYIFRINPVDIIGINTKRLGLE